MIRILIPIATMQLVVLACGGKNESAPAPRLSALGESCLKTSDCVEGTSCIDQKCADPHSAVAPAQEHPDPATGVEALGLPIANPADAPAACKQYDSLIGTWRFTTMVASATDMAARGVNGFYNLEIATSANCALEATITKTGFTNVSFTPDKYQTGHGLLTSANSRELGSVYEIPVTLRRSNGSEPLEIVFFFRFEDENLQGVLHYSGESWRASQMTGGVVGLRGAGTNPSFSAFGSMPRDMACLLHTCTPNSPNGRGFTCGGNFDECARGGRDPVSYLPSVDAPVASPSGTQTPDGLANAVLSALKANSYPRFVANILTLQDIIDAVRAEGSATDREEVKKKFGENLKNVAQYAKRGWDAVRASAERAGVIWSGAKYSRVEFRMKRESGLDAADIDLIFEHRGLEYRIKLDICVKTPKGWRLINAITWKG